MELDSPRLHVLPLKLARKTLSDSVLHAAFPRASNSSSLALTPEEKQPGASTALPAGSWGGSGRPRLGRGHGRHHHAGAGPRPCHRCPGRGSTQPSAPSACRPPRRGHCQTEPGGLGGTVSTRQPHLTARTQEWVLPDRYWLSSPTVPPYTWLWHHRSHCFSSRSGDISLSRTLRLCNPLPQAAAQRDMC